MKVLFPLPKTTGLWFARFLLSSVKSGLSRFGPNSERMPLSLVATIEPIPICSAISSVVVSGRRACVGVTRGSHAYYICHHKWYAPRTFEEQRCRSRYSPVDQLDEIVWQDLCELLRDPAHLTEALQRAQTGDWLPEVLQARQEQHRKAVNALTAQLERLTEAYLAGVFPMEEYRRRREALEQRLAALDQQNRFLQAQISRQMEIFGMCESLATFCQRVQTGLEEATFEQKRQLVELLVDRVVVTMDEVEIRYVIPTSPRSEHIRFCHLHTDYFHPDLIGLHVHQIQLPLLHHGLMNLLAMVSCSISPPCHRAFVQAKRLHNRLNWTAICQQRHHDHNQGLRFA